MMMHGQWINVRIDQECTGRVRIEQSVVTDGAYVALSGDGGQREHWHLTADQTHGLISALQRVVGS